MNDKQEQERIEEMAKIIIKAGESYYKMPVDIECANREAVALYEENYRKQSDTAREIVKRLKELLHKHEHRSQTDGVSFYQMNAESFCDKINELAAQYGVEVETV